MEKGTFRHLAQRKRVVNNLELAYRSEMLDSTPCDIFQQKSRNCTSAMAAAK